MAIRLSQFLAIRRTLGPATKKKLEEVNARVKDSEFLSGMVKTYSPLNPEDKDLVPKEEKLVRGKVRDLIADAVAATNKQLDADLTVDTANADNTADVLLDGKVVISKAPVPFLLQLEKRIDDLITIVSSIVTLDAVKKWSYSDVDGLQRTETVQQQRTRVNKEAITLAAATDKHTAQVQLIDISKVVGIFEVTLFSGSVSPVQKQEAIDKLSALKIAVRSAVAAANQKEATQVTFPREVLQNALASLLK